MASALVVDDDEAVRSALSDLLTRSGYEVSVASGGREGLARAASHPPDVVLLDINMPGIDGWAVLERIRLGGRLPAVVMVSAYGRASDKVRALQLGADDYMTKPFSNAELLARLDTVARRPADGGGVAPPVVLAFGPITIDLERRAASCSGAVLDLTKSEYDLLVVLMGEPNRAFTRQQLAERIYGPAWFGDPHAVDMHVSRLRRKLGDDAGTPRFVETVRGVGFRMATPPAPRHD